MILGSQPSLNVLSHFLRTKSDHRPILLRINPTIQSSFGRPFKFIVGWTKHANFYFLVKDKWNFSSNMASSLSNFTSQVKEWNRSVYEFTGSRKKTLIKSLLNIQKALDKSNSDRLIQLEEDVRDELENLLDHEELVWRQKAKYD